MKISDDYRAKIRFWAANPVVAALPPFQELPKFSVVKFSSHAEMNQWKSEYLRGISHESPNDGRIAKEAE